MRHSKETKQSVIQRRREGASIPQLAKEFSLAKSTVSTWVRDIRLSDQDRIQLTNNTRKGLARSQEARRLHKAEWLKQTERGSLKDVTSLFRSKERVQWQLTAALLFWCEGGKSLNAGIQFANSDPKMVTCFLHALRHGFAIDETKLRALIHLHSYHDKIAITEYWMNITQIPPERFQRPYLKPNTQKRKRKDYPGCISIRYYDKKLAEKLKTLYDSVGKIIEGLGEEVSRRSPKA